MKTQEIEKLTECGHNVNDFCEECCQHDEIPECGHCIDCGALLDLPFEPEINYDR